MVHTGFMPELQLARAVLGDGSVGTTAIANPRQLPPPQVVGDGRRALYLGIDGLLKLASRMRTSGFRASDATLATASGERLDDTEAVDAVLADLNSGKSTSEVLALMDERHIHRLLALNLVRRQPTPASVRITQDGGISVSDNSSSVVDLVVSQVIDSGIS